MATKLLYPNVKIYAFLLLFLLPLFSYSQTSDFSVQHIQDDIGNSGGTNTSFTAVSSINNAFVLANNNRKTHGGAVSNSGNMEGDAMSGARVLTNASTLTYYRQSGGSPSNSSNNMRFNSSIWEYIGPSGGCNELIVRGRFEINLNGTTNSRTNVDQSLLLTGIVDKNKCIPFITGILNNSTEDDADSGTAIAYLENALTLRVQKGSNDNDVTVYVTVVEFTGSNWTVLHGDSGNTNGDTGTITLRDGSDGTGTTTNVSNWSETIIFSHHRGDNNASGTNDAIADNWPVMDPNINRDEVDWSFNGNHASNGTNRHFVHVLSNAFLNVTRFQNTSSTVGETTINISSANLSSINETLIIGSSNSSGGGTAYGRGWRNYYLNSTIEAAHWAHRNGNTMAHEIQIVDLSGLNTQDIDVVDSGSNAINDGSTNSPSGTNSTDFGNVNVGSPSAITYTIENNGSCDLTISSITSDNADFVVSSVPGTVSANGTATFIVTYTPSGTGTTSATITILNNDSDATEQSYTFTVEGTGIAPSPEIDIQGNSTSIFDGDGTPSVSDDTEFGSVNVSGGTVSHTFTIENLGGLVLNLTDPSPYISITGHTSDFTLTANPSNTITASGGTATFTITFDPTVVGLRTAIISIANDDSDENPYNFTIQGTGVVTTYSNVSVSVNWPNWSSENRVEVYNPSGTLLATIDNGYTGSGDNSFSTTIDLGCLEDLNNYYITMYDTFGDGWNGGAANVTVAAGGVTVLTNDGSSTTAAGVGVNDFFNVSGGGAAEMEITGNSIEIADGDTSPNTTDHTDFGTVSVDSGTIVRAFTINNFGCSSLSLTGASPYVSISGSSDFTLTAIPSGTIGTSGSTTFEITFDPGALGTQTATVSIANDDSDENPYNFEIEGFGAEQEINIQGGSPLTNITNGDASPSAAEGTIIGSTSTGTPITSTFTIQNVGDADLTIGAISFSGTDTADFSLSSSPATPITGLGSTTFTVSFDPQGASLTTRNAVISIVNNDINESPYTFALQGTAITPIPEINVVGNGNTITDGFTTISNTYDTDFGSVDTGVAPVSHAFTIENIGSGGLSITSITSSDGEFTITGISLPTSVAGGGSSITFNVVFDPVSLGTINSTITINNDDSDEFTYTFHVEGIGTGTVPDPEYTTYAENFDESSGSWNIITSTNDTWTWTNSFNGTNDMGEGSFWRSNTFNNYNNNTSIIIESPQLDFTGLDNLLFSIDVNYQTENDYDGMRIMYSVAGGAYTLLGSSGSGSNWYDDNTSALGSDGWNDQSHTSTPAFSGNYSHFKNARLNLADGTFSNESNVRFRIEFSSDGGSTENGVAFDNILIKADPILPLNSSSIAPAMVTTNLRLWLKANAGIGATDGTSINLWEDQAYDTSLDKEDAKSSTGLAPTFRDGTSRNINFNPIVDFDNSTTNYMQGKGGYYSQDYFVIVESDDVVDTQTGLYSPGRQFAIGGRYDDGTYHEDPTGLAMGSSTARYSNEVIAHNVSNFPNDSGSAPDDDSYGRAFASTTVSFNQPLLINVKANSGRSAAEIYLNGKQIDNLTGISGNGGTLNYKEFQNLEYLLGTGRSGLTGRTTSQLNGKLGEVVSYTIPNTTLNKHKIQTYLAVKYGITLMDDTSALSSLDLNDVDYIDSAGSIIWDTSENLGFNYDVAGIGKDDDSQLNQKQSKSVNDSNDITVGLTNIYDTNNTNISTNSTNIFTDRNFLMWGNDNGSLAADPAINVNMSAGPEVSASLDTWVDFTPINRIWKVIEVGTVSNTEVAVPEAMLSATLSPPGDYLMFISNSPSFSPTSEYRVMTLNGGNLETTYDFPSNGTKYITFGFAPDRTFTRSIWFDGSIDYLDAGNVLDLNSSFTISSWIKTEDGNSTIISKRDNGFSSGYDFGLDASRYVVMSWNGGTQTLTSSVAIPVNEWHQVAVVYNSTIAKMYIDGVEDTSGNLSVPIPNSESFIIAAADGDPVNTTSFFQGNIDEVRVWNVALTEDQLHFVMNQEIDDNTNVVGAYFNKGLVVPGGTPEAAVTPTKNDITSVPWANLQGYYPMSTYTFTNCKDLSDNDYTAALKNLNTVDSQTAPLPYVSTAVTSTDWDTETTWLNGDVQTIPGAASLVNSNITVDWNIVQISSNVNLSNDDNTIIPSANNGNRNVLGLIVVNNFELEVNGDTSILSTNSNTAGTGNGLTVTHYLGLDGKIDLEGESQLIQTTDSDLVVGSNGELERDQQGIGNIYRYNDWSSPVQQWYNGSAYSVPSDGTYNIAGVLRDGSTSSSPQPISFVGGYDGSFSPFEIANYWLYVRTADPFTSMDAAWNRVGSLGAVKLGEGFLMKGTGRVTDQNYVFQGKPNNGDITVIVKDNNDYLVGNPYPSAIDADLFIDDNSASILGAIYFWDHFGGNSHKLKEYEAGHATYTYMGGVAAASNLAIHTADPSASGTKTPGRYIAVGQAFYVDGKGSGDQNVVFRNSQRIFVEEDGGTTSVFMKPSKKGESSKLSSATTVNSVNADTRTKFRIGFNATNGGHRQLLIGFDERASDNVDYGFDGLIKELNNDDMYWEIDEVKYVIQGTNSYSLDSEFPLGITIEEAGLISIEVDALENVEEDTRLYIKDNLTGETFDITSESFKINLEPGEYSDRFFLVFQPRLKSINEVSLIEGVKAFMDNSQSEFKISRIIDTTILEVQLYNSLGQLIKTWNRNLEERCVSLPIEASTGVYFVQIITSDGEINKKIIIE